MSNLNETVNNVLQNLNSEEITDTIIGYWLEEGDNLGEIFANVVFLMVPLVQDENYDANEVDDACTIVANRLREHVTDTICWFRTQQEFEKDFGNVVSIQAAS